ncbi:hypothetical protein BDP81DRAFT_67207 [Colletotrichum phormii]|uniref:Uncharacterized protein n=1 Tax=Colletotrichum phormii TaxID=359342 RepID=A0AAI9ZMR4_9PEZI|nr:uncharacterized protein BDP81DRAFT_67207 [Colletotrichum phormii]KAK1633512.1 hypothetical protein BDP81DRAFT_67207 [Colletotrichum phormii]
MTETTNSQSQATETPAAPAATMPTVQAASPPVQDQASPPTSPPADTPQVASDVTVEADEGETTDSASTIDERISNYTASLSSSVVDYPMEYGRRYHAFRPGCMLCRIWIFANHIS